MSFGPQSRIKFKQSVSEDVVANRVRIQPAHSTPDLSYAYDEVPKPTPEADGYSYITVGDLPKAANLDGRYDIHVTAVDDAGIEGDFLEVDDQDFDFVPPAAPTDGSIV